MKKNGSRLLSMILAFTLILSSLSSAAFAVSKDEPVNFARTATATASNTEPGTTLFASKAIDGVVDRDTTPKANQSRWAANKSDTQEARWLQLDFGEEKTFDKVVLEWERLNIDSYALQISDDASAWETVYSSKTRNTELRETINLDKPQTARYFRVYVDAYAENGTGETDVNWASVSLFEVEVWGTTEGGGTDPEPGEQPANGTNLALDKAGTASGTESSTTHYPQHAFDGDRTGTRWSQEGLADNKRWLKVDLGQVMTFRQFKIFWEAAYASGYQIQVSDDNSSFTDVYATTNGQGRDEVITLDTPVTGRYVRLYCTQKPEGTWNGVSVYEFEIYNFTDEEIVNAAIQALTVPKVVNHDFTLAVASDGGAEISWESSSDILAIDAETGKVTVTAPAETMDVTLTATVVFGACTKQVSFTANVRSEADRQVEYQVYPTPHKMTLGESSMTISDEVNVVMESGISDITKARLEEVLGNAGLTYTYDAAVEGKTNLYIGVNGSNGEADAYATANNVPRDVFAEGENKFDMEIVQLDDSNNILLLGKDDDAAFYSIATLEQVLAQSMGGKYTAVLFEDYANQQYRGMVEGFYGYPWTVGSRLDWFEFAKKYKMNIFVYGPKGDPYHLGLWDEEYPTSVTQDERKRGVLTQDDIRALATESKKCNIDFVWVAHPAMQRRLNMSSNATVDSEIEKRLLPKFQSLYELGVREFGIFMDDITIGEGLAQKNTQPHLIDQTQKRLYEVYNTADAKEEDKVKPLFYTPTWYTYGLGYADMQNECMTAFKNANVHEDVVLCFTGDAVCGPINNSSCQNFATRTGRKPCIWWNYPVNDYADAQLFTDKMDANFSVSTDTTDCIGVLSNPMNQAEASRIAFFGVADFTWNTANFDSQQNWEDCFPYLAPKGFGDLSSEEVAAAYKVVAKNIVTTPESKDMQDLYTKIKAEYPLGNLTTVKKAKEVFHELNSAIAVMRLMKDCGNEEYERLYIEIEGNLNKLSDMALVIEDCLDVLLSEDDTEAWAAYNEAGKIKTTELSNSRNERYVVHAMEGAGTDYSYRDYQADPSKTHMKPFVNTIYDFATNKVSDVEPVATVPQLFTNIPNVQYTVEDHGSSVTIDGVEGLILNGNEYVGLMFNKIRNLTGFADPEADGLTLEYSMDGKTWTGFTGEDEPEAAFVRIKNNLSTQIMIHAKMLVWTLKPIAQLDGVTTNTALYESYNYPLSHLTDGNYDTKVWTNGAQNAGQTFTMAYTDLINVNEVKLVFGNNADRAKGAVVEISADNINWTEIGSFTEDDLIANGNAYTCNGNGQAAKYVRMRLTASSGNWLQFYEFEVNKGEPMGGAIPIAISSDGQDASAVCDRNVSTVFIGHGAGSVEYKLVHGQKVKKISVLFQAASTATEAPAVEILSNGEWVKIGGLDTNPAKFDVSDYTNVTSVKVSWNAESIPTIMEIVEKGEPYAEPNRVALYEIVAAAKKLSESDYTPDVWAAIQEALKNAEAALNGEGTQETVDAAKTALEDVIGGIEPTAHTLTLNFTTNAQISGGDTGFANLTGVYTESLLPGEEYAIHFVPRVDGREFAAVTVDNEAVKFDEGTNTYVYVCEGIMGYADKTVTVSFVVVDKQILRQVIGIADGLMKGDEFKKAVPSVQKLIEKTFAAAEKVEADKTAIQTEINDAWSHLLDALQMLSFEKGDKTLLEGLLEDAKGVQKENYTADSWAVFEAAREKAQGVYDDPDAMDQEIKEAYDELHKALYDLDFVGDLARLQMLVKKGQEIDLSQYLDLDKDDFKTFRDALAHAEDVLEMTSPTQSVIDKAASALTDALNELRLIPNKDALADLVTEAEAIDRSEYKESSLVKLDQEIENANRVLAAADASQEDINNAYADLYKTMNTLEKKTESKKSSSKGTSYNWNLYGPAGVVAANVNAGAIVPYVVSDTTVDFTVKRGTAYCFKMTVMNSNTAVPSFTVGNGSVLKTQYVTRIGNDFYFRVWAIGAPGQSAGAYTTLPGQNAVKHCTVKIA